MEQTQNVQEKAKPKRIARRGAGAIHEYRGALRTVYYATIPTDNARLGTFESVSLAEQAIDAYLAVMPQAMSDIVEELVEELVEALPAATRTAMFGAAWDPIAECLCRLQVRLTLDQIGRAYGVSRQRIEQLEASGLRKLRGVLEDYRDIPDRPENLWAEIEAMGGE